MTDIKAAESYRKLIEYIGSNFLMEENQIKDESVDKFIDNVRANQGNS
jgi:hypothetical protein